MQRCDIVIDPRKISDRKLQLFRSILIRNPEKGHFDSGIVYQAYDETDRTKKPVRLTCPVYFTRVDINSLTDKTAQSTTSKQFAYPLRTIEIDPSLLSPQSIREDESVYQLSLLLDKLIKTYPKGDSFNDAESYLIRNGDDLLCIALNKNLVYRKSRSGDESRYTVFSLQKENFIGEGASATVYRTMGVVKAAETGVSFRSPDSTDRSVSKPNDHVIKIMNNDKSHEEASRIGSAAPSLRINYPFTFFHPAYYPALKGTIEDNLKRHPWQMDAFQFATYTEDSTAIKSPYFLELDYTKRLTLCLSLLRSLEKLHQSGILHRDIKSDNVILDLKNLKAHLIDFDLSSFATDPSTENYTKGTLAYLAKETVDCCLGEKVYRYTAASELPATSLILAVILGAREPNIVLDDKIQAMGIANNMAIKLKLAKTYNEFDGIFEGSIFSAVSDKKKSEIILFLKTIYSSDQMSRPTLPEIIARFETWLQEALSARPTPLIEEDDGQYAGSQSSLDSDDEERNELAAVCTPTMYDRGTLRSLASRCTETDSIGSFSPLPSFSDASPSPSPSPLRDPLDAKASEEAGFTFTPFL
ncbi:MAG TPA: hypothetical protein VNC84_02995 [Gammaproteobacteria bacterium]|jgi:serine/threonine protein kinase|nr:hypothetical protein [Gammaproteobacteria bacterium]